MEVIDCKVLVSIIIPIYNAAQWLDDTLSSVCAQDFDGNLELSVFNDGSTDESESILKSWFSNLAERQIRVVYDSHKSSEPKGVGYAKNKAILQSHGDFLCFLDADDVMHPSRVRIQFAAAQQLPQNTLLGCGFNRQPEGSTCRYAKWANSLTSSQLYTQVYTSHGPTIVMPTWFCSRHVFDTHMFDETGKADAFNSLIMKFTRHNLVLNVTEGTPEDLLFFLRHVQLGNLLHRVPESLLTYRYHPQAESFSVSEDTIWDIRISAVEENVLAKWDSFTIWNAGKQGRKLYRSLTSENQKKVIAFCDVDEKKIAKGHYVYEESQETTKPIVPIIHFTDAKPPFIICMKLDLTGGKFEENLASLNLNEGKDYFHFN